MQISAYRANFVIVPETYYCLSNRRDFDDHIVQDSHFLSVLFIVQKFHEELLTI